MARILYLDDYPEQLDSTRFAFTTCHDLDKTEHHPLELETHVIEGGMSPVGVHVAKTFDVVVLDNHWGKGAKEDGVGFARQLRQAGYTKPIILFSGEDPENVRKPHMDYYDSLGLIFCHKIRDGGGEGLYRKIQDALGPVAGRRASAQPGG